MSEEDNDIFKVGDSALTDEPVQDNEEQAPLYRIYEDSRIPVSRSLGTMWKKKLDAAIAAYQCIYEVWDEVIRYYNNNQSKTIQTPRGTFKRGDATENVLYSNINMTLPAIYSRDPNVTCSTIDETDKPFCDVLEAVLTKLLRKPTALNAKPKIKRAAGYALLTDFGVLKVKFTQKDDSREQAMNELSRITESLQKAKNTTEVEKYYGEMTALEHQMEVLEPSGFSMRNVLPHNLIIDPYAEDMGGTDAEWEIERIFESTAGLNARFTKPSESGDGRVLSYKPTHKARFTSGGSRDDGLGVVMDVISASGDGSSSVYRDDAHTAYINQYYTECYLIYDKKFRRIYMFQRDDWKWPIWVWDEAVKTSRFFPYFVIGFHFSTGGVVTVGENAYVLDQQDEVNDINRQMTKLRKSVFDYFWYNSDSQVSQDEIEKFVKLLRGETSRGKHVLGIRAGNQKLSDVIQAVPLPSVEYEALFDKTKVLETINRITNTNDALRGVQFKSYTNVASVNSYQESMRLSVGSKVDVIEDVVADVANFVAEIAVQTMEIEDVAALVGEKKAAAWKPMTLDEFEGAYSVEIVAGSMEKANSVFKKKEAVEISQALGQFAQAAPGAVLRIMLKVLEQAFSEVVISQSDWEALDAEIQASMRKGDSTTGAQGGDTQQILEAAKQLPDEVKAHVMQMKQGGAPDQEILKFIQQQIAQLGQQPQPQVPQQPQSQVQPQPQTSRVQ